MNRRPRTRISLEDTGLERIGLDGGEHASPVIQLAVDPLKEREFSVAGENVPLSGNVLLLSNRDVPDRVFACFQMPAARKVLMM